MANTTPILPIILALMLSGYSTADDLSDAADGLCDTIRTCALEAVAGQDLTDQLRHKMEPILENNCAQMRSQVRATPANQELYQAAVGCLRSMESLSCPQLHNMSAIQTPECGAYDGLLKAADAVTP